MTTAFSIEYDPISSSGSVSLSQLLGSFSYALDLACNRSPGHTLRACILGMKLGRRAGLNEYQLDNLFYALLLKDIGISEEKRQELEAPFPTTKQASLLWKLGYGALARPQELSASISLALSALKANMTGAVVRRMVATASLRSRHTLKAKPTFVARLEELGFTTEIEQAILHADLRWNENDNKTHQGSGSLLSQIIKLAQTLDEIRTVYGNSYALDCIHYRCEGWFDPGFVAAANLILSTENQWEELDKPDLPAHVSSLEPVRTKRYVNGNLVDKICRVFADIIDNKLQQSDGHSSAVADLSERIAMAMNVPREQLSTLRRAALLHNAGNLAFASQQTIHRYNASARVDHGNPTLSMAYQHISKVPGMQDAVAVVVGRYNPLEEHGVSELNKDTVQLLKRILDVAEVAQKLADGKNHSQRLTHEDLFKTMQTLTPHLLDAECVRALYNPAVLGFSEKIHL